jgi:N-carbamoyl-D-amino-acid hydrolase
MARRLSIAGAQLGPIGRGEPRAKVVQRLIALMREAKGRGAELVVFPELALTTFFPRWHITDAEELESYYETEMPSSATLPLFEEAKRLGIAFHLGFAERVVEEGRERRFNTAILVDHGGAIIAKYRKIHLPGHAEPDPARQFQHLEKRYFEPGNLGFRTWDALGGVLGILLCNDRRWPEAFRVLGLQGVELVLIGYNTPAVNSQIFEPPHLRAFHNHLTMQAGAYQNGTWVVGVAKAGCEGGVDMMGGSAIISPNGEIMAQSASLEDELILAVADLDAGTYIKQNIFNFAAHRRPEDYRLIVETVGALRGPGAR